MILEFVCFSVLTIFTQFWTSPTESGLGAAYPSDHPLVGHGYCYSRRQTEELSKELDGVIIIMRASGEMD